MELRQREMEPQDQFGANTMAMEAEERPRQERQREPSPQPGPAGNQSNLDLGIWQDHQTIAFFVMGTLGNGNHAIQYPIAKKATCNGNQQMRKVLRQGRPSGNVLPRNIKLLLL
ncbi:unnamed protein product [Cylicostephanus goldi]|uniref:Uncharacterized protein n=1 Tax=Cylicostephanus goldi TaxID=71465 RepID=A0A3P6RFF1_CYLGO|nr:unnamed protein product [Cylicostephanus goldi]